MNKSKLKQITGARLFAPHRMPDRRASAHVIKSTGLF